MDSREEVTLDEQETPAPPAQPRRGGRLPNIPRPRLRRGDSGPPSLIDPVLKKVRSYNPKADLKEIQRAFMFAEDSHEGQKRKSGEDFIEHPVAVAAILADLRLDTTTLEAALLHDTVEDTARHARGDRGGVRRGGRAHRRRPHEARPVRVPHARAGAGRERPQDDRGDGRRHPRAADQARRPPAQHAHAGRVPRSQAAPHRHRDPGDLRAARASPRCPGAEVGARGPLVQGAAPRALPRDREPGRCAPRRTHRVDRTGHHRVARQAEGARGQGRGRGPPEAPVLHLREDGDARQGVQRDLRPRGRAHPGGLAARLLRGARRGPLPVEADPRPLQGLHRDAQVEHVPVAAHHGGGSGRQAAGDPDANPRHAPHGQVRHRGALALQGGRQAGEGRRRHGLARPDDGVAEGHGRPSRVHGGPEDRPLRGAGLRVHAEGRRGEPAGGRHARGLRLRDPHRRGSPHDRRQGGGQAGAARLRAPDRRRRRRPHLQGPGRGAVAGLAAVRQDAAGTVEDPAVVLARPPRGRPGAGARRRAAVDAQGAPAHQAARHRSLAHPGRRPS